MTTHKQLLVLIVDDEDAVRKVAEAMLKFTGYAVMTAAGGFEALQLAQQHKDDLDLVVTDLVMPKMDGLALANQIVQVCPRTRVLLMSGCTDMLAQAKATHWPFLSKPFGKDALLGSVRAALSREPNAEYDVA